MRTFELEGKLRENLGKKEAKRLRREKQVPCVLYGQEENLHFYCDFEAVRKMIYTPYVFLVNLKIDGKDFQAIMQDIQYHPVTDMPLHIDFLKTYDDKPVKVNIPVVTEGFARGIREGGRLQVEMRRLWVSALPKDLPDEIKIDVTKLRIGDSYRVSDVETDTLKILNVKSVPVVRVMVTRASRSAGGELLDEEEGEETSAAGGESEENAEE
ncbi:MAG TPA: 50S ribosomal protein L25/general stress protein Ctc [Prolixibacteraceae bacterium]|nr:50S ribosomal protein L25/general stress protein Ctc [Prolixibacteraceae bacterium]